MAFRLKRSGAILAFVLLLFFASGFAALLYQTIWQRMLGFFSGVDVYSVTITVAAFMAGLGCGSLAGGHLADRLSSKSRLLAFGVAEGIITIFALGSKWIYLRSSLFKMERDSPSRLSSCRWFFSSAC